VQKNAIGKRLKELRTRSTSPITQAELAARLQVLGSRLDRVMISKIENGQRPVSDLEILALARAMKISINDLFEDAERINTKR
jgi:HTH-type transcriptional regulator, cell division transcriptional repressor